MSLPAVEVGLHLDQRVVRRHVAKLEAAGWLVRAPWIWGEGSVVWLTGSGVEAVGLGGIRPVKSPPGATTIHHGVLAGWSAARVERRGRLWRSARELALDEERWAVPMRCERGFTRQLPDLAVWLKRSGPPVAVIAESGGRREDRQKMILEGWRDAIHSGRYACLHYHCTSASVAHWINRLAKKIWLDAPTFAAVVQMSAAEITAIAPEHDPPVDAPKPAATVRPAPDGHERTTPVRSAGSAEPARLKLAEPPPAPTPESAEAVTARERLLRELTGVPEAKPRRRWRR